MSTPSSGSGAVLKVALKRADVVELVWAEELLRSSPFVVALGAQGQSVLKLGTARRYPDRTVLFQQGEAGCSLFFVLRGEVRLSARKGTDVVELGRAVQGDVCGEAEALTGGALRTSSAVAQGDLDAVELAREGLLEGGRLVRRVADLLTAVGSTRQAALLEMTDFLNRW